MLNHASLGVKDLARAGAFYDELFRPMNIQRAADVRPNELAYGPIGTPASLCPFWLYQASSDSNVVGEGTHIAFGVETRAVLDRIGALADAARVVITRRAGPHPDISLGYYGLVLRDVEGHKIEFVALEGAG